MTDRELDALVAEKVMGYTGRTIVYKWRDRGRKRFPLIAYTGIGTNAPHPCWSVGQRCVSEDGAQSHSDWWGLPHFSTDIAAAWKVVERMRELGWKFRIEDTSRVLPGVWAAFLPEGADPNSPGAWIGAERDSDDGPGPWEPAAIRDAALMALGVEVPAIPDSET